MRDLVVAKIEELIGPEGRTGSRYGILFGRVGKRRRRKPPLTREEIIADGLYPHDIDFSTLSDSELLKAFQRVVQRYSTWM